MTDANLKTRLTQSIYPALLKDLGLDNFMSLPRVKKIVINIGISKSDTSDKEIKTAASELAAITGQTPRVAKAKKSVAGFKIRVGDAVGVTVTLRGARMYNFLDKLCRIVLPQVKDFKGVKRETVSS